MSSKRDKTDSDSVLLDVADADAANSRSKREHVAHRMRGLSEIDA